MDELKYESESFYLFDRAYIDYERLYTIHKTKAFFVVRDKNNFKFKRHYSMKCDKTKGVCCDQIVVLIGFYTVKDYPDKIMKNKIL